MSSNRCGHVSAQNPSTVGHLALAVFLFAAWALGGCAGGPPERAKYAARYPVGYVDRGVASWYGPGFHGRTTANGERYDMYKLTAAHRTLPMGSVVQVRSLTNGRRVTVRINDRGPFTKGRIIDLSLAAAKALRMTGKGTDQVEIKVVAYRGRRGAFGSLRVQVASFAVKVNAQALAGRLRGEYRRVHIRVVELISGRRYRVVVGPFTSEQQAEAAADRLAVELGVEPLVVREVS